MACDSRWTTSNNDSFRTKLHTIISDHVFKTSGDNDDSETDLEHLFTFNNDLYNNNQENIRFIRPISRSITLNPLIYNINKLSLDSNLKSLIYICL